MERSRKRRGRWRGQEKGEGGGEVKKKGGEEWGGRRGVGGEK